MLTESGRLVRDRREDRIEYIPEPLPERKAV